MRGAPFMRTTDRVTVTNIEVCRQTVGTPYFRSIDIPCAATAGAQVLQWPTPMIAASPFSLISCQVSGSSLV